MLVLDDPLSAVDTETEGAHRGARSGPALAGRTVLLSTQRLSTVSLADRAVVLENGVIVEDAPPEPPAQRGRARSSALFAEDEGPCRAKPPSRAHSALSLYVGDQRARIALLALAAAFTSAVQVGGWLLVGDAIDNGIRAQDTGRLDLDVAIYVGANAMAWLVGSFLIIGLAQLGQLIVLRLREHLFEHLTDSRCATSRSSARAGSSRASRTTWTRSRTCSRRASRRSSATSSRSRAR